MRYGFGVDLGGTTVKLGFFSEDGNLIEKWEIPTRKEQSGALILPDIAAAISGYLQDKSIPKQQLVGIGIGVPGPVGPDGTVNRCINLGWGVFNIEKELAKLTGLPVKAGNDASLAALGECWKGGGAGYRNIVFATLGTGVGGGIIANGNVIHGIHGAGGEIGHMTLNRDEQEPCNCGKRGCVEQYCSATGIVRLAKQYLAKTDAQSILRTIQMLTCKDVFDAAAAGDAPAQAILEQVYAYIAEFLGNICCVTDPDTVVLGGGVSKAGKPLLDGVQRHFKKYVFHAILPVNLALATLGNDAGAYGAFKLILDSKGE